MMDSMGLISGPGRRASRPWQTRAFGRNSDSCAKVMAAFYRDLECVLAGYDRSRVACAAGCASCCVVNVSVLMPEAIALVQHLRKALAPGLSVELAERVGRHYREVRGLDDQQRLSLQASCAFLDEQGACLVYPLRPLMCRAVSSIDPVSCRAALTAGDGETAPPVLMHLHQKQLFDGAFIELAQTLASQGLDDRSTTLTTAAYHLLAQPDLAAVWLQGGPVPQG